MNGNMALEKTIYIGPFIQCETLTELDVVPNGMIGVNEQGKIAFVLRTVKGRQMPAGEGWEDAKIVRIQDHGFFFPGFIGKCIQEQKSSRRRLTNQCRYAHSRTTVPKCWNFWQINTSGLAKYIYLPTGGLVQRLG